MKKFLFMEGFKSWPEVANSSSGLLLGSFLTKTMPLIDGQSSLAFLTSSTAGISKEGFVLDGVKYSGIYVSGGSGQISMAVPKTAAGTKKRTYFGGRMAGNGFSLAASPVTLTASTAISAGKFDANVPASHYIETVIDHSTGKLTLYINKLKKGEYTITAAEITRIANGTARLFFGTYSTNTNAFANKIGVFTDFYIATEEWDTEVAPDIEIFGPVTVDSYAAQHVDATNFVTDAASMEEALAGPYKGVYVAKDQPLYTNNDDEVGTITFAPVPDSSKLKGAMLSLFAMRGASSGATLVTKINDGTTDIVSDSYIPTISSATVTPITVYDLAPAGGVTPESLNKIKLMVNSKETT